MICLNREVLIVKEALDILISRASCFIFFRKDWILNFPGAFTVGADRPVTHVINPAIPSAAAASSQKRGNNIGFKGFHTPASRAALAAGLPKSAQTGTLAERALPCAVVGRPRAFRGRTRRNNIYHIISHFIRSSR